jgi:hypothetical protein
MTGGTDGAGADRGGEPQRSTLFDRADVDRAGDGAVSAIERRQAIEPPGLRSRMRGGSEGAEIQPDMIDPPRRCRLVFTDDQPALMIEQTVEDMSALPARRR